jgi:hypothetical protein
MHAFAQNDSLYTDTVVIIKPPVIIKQKVHVYVPIKSDTLSFIDAGLYLSLAKDISSSSQAVTGIFLSSGFQVRFHLGNFEVGTGMGIVSSKIIYPSQKHTVLLPAPDKMEVKEKLIQTYHKIDPVTGQLLNYYVYESDTSYVKQTTEETSYSKEVTHRLNYLQIPLSVGYSFHRNSGYVTPSGFLMYNRNIKGVEDTLASQKQMWSVGLMLSAGYQINSRLLVEIKMQYQRTLASPYQDESYKNDHWNLLGIGIGAYIKL